MPFLYLGYNFIFMIDSVDFNCYNHCMDAIIYGRRLVLQQRDCGPLFT